MEENEKNYLDWEGLLEYHEKLNAELDKKVNSSDLADVATSGNYNDLENTPTNVSLFTNDAGYITSEIDNTNGHDYIEIGGIKWATMNIGAENVTDIGLYFQWGDILGYISEEVGVEKDFTWNDYKFNPSGDGTTFTKYNSTDEKTYLDTEDDAAASAWGSDWRVPSASELQTLSLAVNVSWASDYEDSGVSGLILTDKEDSSKVLFLPVTGVCNDGSIIDGTTTGFYWSKSLGNTDDKGFGLGFDETNGATWNYSNSRSLGFAIRPVLEGPEKRTIMGVTLAEKDAWNNSYSKEEINDKLNTLNEKVENPPIASANTLGSIKVGDGLSIDNSGVLSAESGGSVEVVQTTGTSITAVISQKGVTDVITENEEVVSTALNDLNDRVENLEEVLAVSAVEYNTTAKKITETINGVTSDVVTASDIVIDGGGLTSIQAVAGSHINEAGTPTVTASTTGSKTTLTFDYLKGLQGPAGEQGPKGDDGVTPTINAAAGSNIGSVGTPSVTATTSGNTTTFTFNYLKGASGTNGTNGTTPTIKAAAGSAIGSVGTPSVTASTSGTTTTFTFNYLKGNTGAQGPKGPKGDTGATGAQGPRGATGPQGPAGVTGVSFLTGNATVTAGNGGYIITLPYTQANAKKVYSCRFYKTNADSTTISTLGPAPSGYYTSNTAYGKSFANCFLTTTTNNPGTTIYRLIVAN